MLQGVIFQYFPLTLAVAVITVCATAQIVIITTNTTTTVIIIMVIIVVLHYIRDINDHK